MAKPSSDLPRVFLIGLGRAGQALGLELVAAGVPIAGSWSRSERSLDPGLAPLCPTWGGAAPAREALRAADVVLLAVADSAIFEASAQLALRPGQTVLHLSGSLPAVLLQVPEGVHRGCYHPLQALASVSGSALPVPPYCVAIEGDPEARAHARAIADATGHQCVEVAAAAKGAYHAAAVLASNSLVALQAVADRVMQSAGVEAGESWELLWPLVVGSLGNLRNGDFAQALTGPIARGDDQTVARNLSSLGKDQGALAVYRALAAEAVGLSEQAGLDEPGAALMRKALGEGS